VNAFSLRGKSATHYVTLGLAVLFALGSVAAAGLVARTPMRRRWLWALVALVGAGTFQLDWTTGATRIVPFNVLLLSSSVMRPGAYASWVVSFAFPVGAMLALQRRRRALRSASARLADLER
jgi:hypothetical protein